MMAKLVGFKIENGNKDLEEKLKASEKIIAELRNEIENIKPDNNLTKELAKKDEEISKLTKELEAAKKRTSEGASETSNIQLTAKEQTKFEKIGGIQWLKNRLKFVKV
jgi:predicted RNase H-like nuclease (RuvC/YqgF family)